MFDGRPATLRLGGYREFAPSAPLGEAVECYWVHVLEPAQLAGPPPVHRVLPHLGASLIFSRRRDLRGETHDPALSFQGPAACTDSFPLVPGEELVAVRFHPEWTAAILGVPAGELWDLTAPYGELLPDAGGPLLSALERTRTVLEASRILARWAEGRALRLPRASLAGQWTRVVLRRLRETRGRIRLGQLARDLGRSPQHLTRTLRSELATTPKQVARVLRFGAVVSEADAQGQPRWAELAARGGYCDQAHLVRECRSLTELTPGALHRERRSGFELSKTVLG